MPGGQVPVAPRTVLVAGAGGAGRTAVACALAARGAAAGRRVLLISIGRVADPLTATPAAGYDHVHLNPIRLLADWWERTARAVAASRPMRGDGEPPGFDPFVLEPPEITGLADAEHLLTLAAVHRYATGEGGYDDVLVDAPGFEHLAALLTAPATVAAYLERVWPRHVRLSGPATDGPATGALAGLILAERLTVLAEQLAAFVGDRDALRLLYVLVADGGRIPRARSELAALEVLGLRPAAIVLNRVLRADSRFAHDLPHPALQWFARRLADQEAALSGAAEFGAALARPVLTVDEAPAPLADAADAGRLDVSRPGGSDTESGGPAAGDVLSLLGSDDAAPPAVRHVGGTGLDARYEWTVELPLVDPATIGLGRVEEDVVIDAEGVRRRIRLPSVLRRCVVEGASYSDDALHVSFVPDPEVWPRGGA
ncbi:ArsA-related P-loop ATPase [Tsukamurella sp. 8F]|uniref:ArsA family ATPase n=1 Tax=unclassified Tsukamurella TaxID=2633480 RepID=UPI0023B9820B|nr:MULTISPECIES: ArsA-related P-loop ATPase [unclassified Tsukamurella]MDF0532014.1 ArsA-related P-loop ATPase [Tsukamurella sp. 8J]MDF0588419.1 ArsA-related P-loop ATPase [Tsukamurella sp. 8F]